VKDRLPEDGLYLVKKEGYEPHVCRFKKGEWVTYDMSIAIPSHWQPLPPDSKIEPSQSGNSESVKLTEEKPDPIERLRNKLSPFITLVEIARETGQIDIKALQACDPDEIRKWLDVAHDLSTLNPHR
jgi:hypothetical protein